MFENTLFNIQRSGVGRGGYNRGRPFFLRVRSSKSFIVSGCALALFTDCFLYGLVRNITWYYVRILTYYYVIPVFPFALTQRAHMEPKSVQLWTTTLLACYAGASLLTCPAAGFFTTSIGSRRIPFIVGLLVLVISTLLLNFGSSTTIFLLGRLLQGSGSAITWTAGLTLVADAVGKAHVGSAMGICSLGSNMALVCSPLFGGLLLDRGGYHWVFAPAWGLICIDLIWRLAIIERPVASSTSAYRTEDYWILTYGDGGTPIICQAPTRTQIRQQIHRYSEEQNFHGLFQEARASGRVYYRRAIQSLSPWTIILRDTRFQVAFWANIAQITILGSLDAVLPLFVREVFSWGPRGAGLIFIPVLLPSFIGVYAGRLTDIYGPKWLVTVGFSAASPLFVLLRFVTGRGTGQIVLLCSLLTLLSTALAFVGAPLMTEVVLTLESQERRRPGLFGPKGAMAQAYALYSVSLFGGILIGTLWAGLLEKAVGWKTMTCSLGILGAVMVIPTVLFTGGTTIPRLRRRSTLGC